MLKFLRFLFFPFAVIYDLITRVRNYLYDIGHKSSFRFEVPVISVGNLNLGGSGKTPMTEYLIGLLQGTYHIATLSRGYGRKTKGPRFAGSDDNASTIGDEPFQFFKKFGEKIKVAVSEERAVAIPEILQEYPDVDLILLDDAFQHRSVNPHLSVLLTEYEHPFFNDYVVPTGNLREARRGAKRADIVVVTKCPAAISNQEEIKAKIKRYAGEKPLFFTSVKYNNPVSFGGPMVESKNAVLVSGIAKANGLKAYVESRYNLVHHFHFADHHSFTEENLEEIVGVARTEKSIIITTEKDMARLVSGQFDRWIKENPWYYLPIEIYFLHSGSEFDRLILQSLEKLKGD